MDYLFLSKTILFRGISPQEIEGMMSCLQATVKTFPRGANIYYAGPTNGEKPKGTSQAPGVIVRDKEIISRNPALESSESHKHHE